MIITLFQSTCYINSDLRYFEVSWFLAMRIKSLSHCWHFVIIENKISLTKISGIIEIVVTLLQRACVVAIYFLEKIVHYVILNILCRFTKCYRLVYNSGRYYWFQYFKFQFFNFDAHDLKICAVHILQFVWVTKAINNFYLYLSFVAFKCKPLN